MRHYWLVRIWTTLSAGGLFLGTLFFAASLTPSLLPRTYVIQGVLSGYSFAAGYGIGVFWRWLWSYMELPMPKDRTLRITKLSAAVLCALITVGFLWKTAPWQNSIRKLMQMEPVTSAHPFEVCAIALGGAIATHVRIGSPIFSHTLFGVYLGILLWGGLYLRDERLRAIFPFR